MNSNVYYKCVAYDDGFETKEGTRLHKCLFVAEDSKDWLEKIFYCRFITDNWRYISSGI